MLRGISTNFVLSPDGTQVTMPASDVTLLQQANAQVARVDLHLGSKATWDSQIVANYTTVLNELIAGGIQVLGLLGYGIVAGATQDQWNTGAIEQGGPGINTFVDQYASAAYDIVRAFPQIHAWEIGGNEPNEWTSQPSPAVYTGGSFIYPSLFAALLAAAQPIIKQHNSSDTVITGGLLAQDNQNTNEDSSGATYLKAVYAALWALGYNTHTKPFDGIGVHFYLDQKGALNPQTLMRYILQYFQVVVGAEGPDRWTGLYVTESGTDSSIVGPAQQAANISTLFSYLRAVPYVKAVLNYQNRDNSQHFGIYNADGSPKPARDAFKNG